MMIPVPPMRDPLSMYWEQPDPCKWLFDETHVVIPERDLQKLASYDTSMPSGVYEGKMWQRKESVHVGGRHMLVWYGPSELVGQCGIYFREILTVGGAS